MHRAHRRRTAAAERNPHAQHLHAAGKAGQSHHDAAENRTRKHAPPPTGSGRRTDPEGDRSAGTAHKGTHQQGDRRKAAHQPDHSHIAPQEHHRKAGDQVCVGACHLCGHARIHRRRQHLTESAVQKIAMRCRKRHRQWI